MCISLYFFGKHILLVSYFYLGKVRHVNESPFIAKPYLSCITGWIFADILGLVGLLLVLFYILIRDQDFTIVGNFSSPTAI